MKTAEQESRPAKIDVKDAAESAKKYCRRLFPKSVLSLEEVERSEDDTYWLITLGVHDQETLIHNQVMKSLPWAARHVVKLKVFKVDSTTGRVVSMKMR
jgi:hypothetical protein